MSFKHTILGLLANGPLHGYHLKTAYEEGTGPLSPVNYGQIYATLVRLHKEGLVHSQVVEQDERPDRKVYELTQKGRDQLEQWLQQPVQLDLDLRNELVLKLLIAQRLEDVDAMAVLQRERRACFERLHELTRAQGQSESATFGARLMLDLAVLRLEAFIKWLDRCETLFIEDESQ